jgi:3-oxoacyl-[acyl-carrier protein] reductase
MTKNKVIIITGAAGGIGSATAQLLAHQGNALVLADIRRERLEDLGKRLERLHAKFMLVKHNVTDLESWESLMNIVKNEFGRIDVLINNAGVVQPGAAEKISTDKIQQQVSVNLLGTIYGCRAVLKIMKQQNSGKIVNIASLGGIVPMPGEAVYSATKYAIRGYSLSLAAELQGTALNLTVVCPDSVKTDQLDYELQHDEAVLSFIGKALEPQKVAKGIIKALVTKKPEILIPAGTGVFARVAMAFPKFYFLVLPLLKKLGQKNMIKRREERKQERLACADYTSSSIN